MGLKTVFTGPLRAIQSIAGSLAASIEPTQHGPPTLEALNRQLGSCRVGTRERAAMALGRFAARNAAQALKRATRDPRRRVRQAALSSLLRIDPEQFVQSSLALADKVVRNELFDDFDAALRMAEETGRFSK